MRFAIPIIYVALAVCALLRLNETLSLKTRTVEDRINALTPPLEVAAISTEGDVLITDVTGKLFIIPGKYAIARTISATLKPGHVLLKEPPK